MRSSRLFMLVALTLTCFLDCRAQDSPPPETPSVEARFVKQFLRDEANLWTSPLRIKTDSLKWMVPLGIATAGLLKTDRNVSGELREDQRILAPSHNVSQLGSYPLFLTPVALIVLGRATNDARTVHAGGVALQAVMHSALIVQALKASTNRERPDKTRGDGGFWDGGKSFPSGHAMASSAFAAALADQYSDKKWIGIGAYSLAAAVGISRVTGQNHFPSDVLIGSSMGWLIGHYISRHHK
jgi:membrane-associated phospholipid phosphatase